MKAQLCSGGVEGGSDESVTIASTSAREEDDNRIGVGATSHKSHFHCSHASEQYVGDATFGRRQRRPVED